MATLSQLGFEIERRIIVFHRDTTMPDTTQLGYTGDPNDCVNGATPGQTLLFNCPSGTLYLDKSVSPHDKWTKVEDTAGGLWIKEGTGGTPPTSQGDHYETFTGTNEIMKNRYLEYAGKPSNIVGLPILFDGAIKGVVIKSAEPCSGWVRIRQNDVNLYSIQMSSQDLKIVSGISKDIFAGDSVSVLVESSNGMNYPTVRIYIQ